jgi:hypothetical protein
MLLLLSRSAFALWIIGLDCDYRRDAVGEVNMCSEEQKFPVGEVFTDSSINTVDFFTVLHSHKSDPIQFFTEKRMSEH